MTRILRWAQLISFSGVLFAGACLPDNFWSDLWGNTIINGTVEAVQDVILGAILPQ